MERKIHSPAEEAFIAEFDKEMKKIIEEQKNPLADAAFQFAEQSFQKGSLLVMMPNNRYGFVLRKK
jgi:hypothetical protein